MTKIDGRTTRPQLLEAAQRFEAADRELLASGINGNTLAKRLGITRWAAYERIRKAKRRQAALAAAKAVETRLNHPAAVDSDATEFTQAEGWMARVDD